MRTRARSHMSAAVLLLTVGFGGDVVDADDPRAQFDVSRLAVCRDVTTREFAELNPDEKLVEAPLQISLLVYRGRTEQVAECLYRLECPAQTTQIVDYLPKTTMESRVAGNIEIEKRREGTKQVDLSLGGSLDQVANGNVSTSRIKTSHAAIRYELLPPREMLAAAGTTGRGTGVYFKLRRSPQLSLEGSRDFVLVMRVPRSWRGDYLRVICQAARGDADSTHSSVSSRASFLVPVYLAGDALAKSRAAAVFAAERELFTLAERYQREIQRCSQPTWAHELSLKDPRIPASWLARLVHSDDTRDTKRFPFERYLPQEVQQAVDNYRLAKSQLRALGESTAQSAMTAAIHATTFSTADAETTPDRLAEQTGWIARQSPATTQLPANGG